MKELPPGSPEAIVQGCTCDPDLNNNGDGRNNRREAYTIDSDCPVH